MHDKQTTLSASSGHESLSFFLPPQPRLSLHPIVRRPTPFLESITGLGDFQGSLADAITKAGTTAAQSHQLSNCIPLIMLRRVGTGNTSAANEPTVKAEKCHTLEWLLSVEKLSWLIGKEFLQSIC
jgi:hypothetical protein